MGANSGLHILFLKDSIFKITPTGVIPRLYGNIKFKRIRRGSAKKLYRCNS